MCSHPQPHVTPVTLKSSCLHNQGFNHEPSPQPAFRVILEKISNYRREMGGAFPCHKIKHICLNKIIGTNNNISISIYLFFFTFSMYIC